MKTCVAAVCGMFMLLVSCSGSREFKPAFNQPLQPVMQPGFVYVDQVAPLVKTNLKYAGYDNFVGRPLDGYHGRRAILRTQAAQALKGEILPEDIAQMVLFLCSDVSRMCAGQNFIVDAGTV